MPGAMCRAIADLQVRSTRNDAEQLQNYVFVHLTAPLLRLCERVIERCRAPALKAIHRPILDLTYWIQKQIVDYVATRDEEKSSEELEKHLEEMSRVIGRERRKREARERERERFRYIFAWA